MTSTFNEEFLQLMSLVKNDERYFKRIEELKEKQLELSHVLEIAGTVKEADMYLANARQQAAEIRVAAEEEAKEIKERAAVILRDNRAASEKVKAKKEALDAKEQELVHDRQKLKQLEVDLEKSIEEHRKLTAERTAEAEAAVKVRHEFETKLKKMRELAAATI